MQDYEKQLAEQEGRTGAKKEIAEAVVLFLSAISLLPFHVGLLSRAGVAAGSAYTASVLSMSAGTFILGKSGNFSLLLGPGLALNYYLVYTLIISSGLAWGETMGCLLLAGLLMLAVARRGWYLKVCEAIPHCLLTAMRAGLGLLIIVTALEQGHLLVPSTVNATALGDFADPVAFLSLWGLFIAVVLYLYKPCWAVPGGVIATAAGACGIKLPDWPEYIFSVPDYPVQAGQIDFASPEKLIAAAALIVLILIVENGLVLSAYNRLQQNEIPARNIHGIRLVALGNIAAAFLGAGAFCLVPAALAGNVTVNGRGRAAVLAALFVLLLLFCSPLAQVLAQCSFIAVPVLFIAGFLLFQEISSLNWDDKPEAIPALMTVVFIALGGIMAGVGIGFISFCVLKLLEGRGRSVQPMTYVLAILFSVQMVVRPL